ncbi:hypothetical protein [Actinoallomurus sp. NPDC050550]|uniref:hypothetical protein n=1 Tax=Actinoallomurus sp. NPDC050550 TaxID=3154937 RepID=UPI0033CC8738
MSYEQSVDGNVGFFMEFAAKSREILAPGVPDYLISEALKDAEFANQYPELEAYLSRRDKSVNHDINTPLDRWSEKALISGSQEYPVRVQLSHDPTIPDRLIDVVVENVVLAVSRVQAAGFFVPDFDVFMPKYARSLRLEVVEPFTSTGRPRGRLKVAIINDEKVPEARAFPYHGALGVNIQSPGIPDDERMPLYSDVGPSVVPGMIVEYSTAIIVHELGHLLHDIRYNHPLLSNVAMRDATLPDLFGYVSEYARRGVTPAEFVAEFFVLRVYGLVPEGDPIFGRLDEVYRDFGGPMPIRARTGFPDLPLDGRKRQRLMALVNEDLRRRGLQGVATEGHIDAVYASAPEIRLLVMEEKAGRIADALQPAQSVAPMPPQVPSQGWWWPSGPAAGGPRSLPEPPALPEGVLPSDVEYGDEQVLYDQIQFPAEKADEPAVSGRGQWPRINRSIPGVTALPAISAETWRTHTEPAEREAAQADLATFTSRQYPVLDQLNPTRGTPNYNQAVLAVDRMISGDTAVRIPPTSIRGFYGAFRLKGQHQGQWVPVSSYDDIISRIDSEPGSRGVVYIGGPDNSAHLINVIHSNDGVVFIDGQAGALAALRPDADKIGLLFYRPGDQRPPALVSDPSVTSSVGRPPLPGGLESAATTVRNPKARPAGGAAVASVATDTGPVEDQPSAPPSGDAELIPEGHRGEHPLGVDEHAIRSADEEPAAAEARMAAAEASATSPLTTPEEAQAGERSTTAGSEHAPEQLDARYGKAVPPKVVKPHELDPQNSEQARLNPLWFRLEDFPAWLLDDRPDAVWHYVVDEDGQIRLGSEEIMSALRADEWRRLHEGFGDEEFSQVEHLQDALGGVAHPTIAASFTEDGAAVPGSARISGELRWNAEGRRWEVNDKSGRYMSKKVRPNLDPQDAARWTANVAEDLSRHLGVEVVPVLYKHAAQKAPEQEEPVAEVQAAVQKEALSQSPTALPSEEPLPTAPARRGWRSWTTRLRGLVAAFSGGRPFHGPAALVAHAPRRDRVSAPSDSRVLPDPTSAEDVTEPDRSAGGVASPRTETREAGDSRTGSGEASRTSVDGRVPASARTNALPSLLPGLRPDDTAEFEPDRVVELGLSGRSVRLDAAADADLNRLVDEYAQALTRNVGAGASAPAVRISVGRGARNRLTPAYTTGAAIEELFLDRLVAHLNDLGVPEAERTVRTNVAFAVQILTGRPVDRGRVRVETRLTAGAPPVLAAPPGADSSAAPAGAGDTPLPPWYARHGGFGDGGVSSMAEVTRESVPSGGLDAGVDRWLTAVTAGRRASTATEVRKRIIAVLRDENPRAWERLLRHGKLILVGGMRVKLTFSAEELDHAPPSKEPADPDRQDFFSKYGDTSYKEGESRQHQNAGAGGVEPLLFLAAAAHGGVSHVSPSVKVGTESGYSSGRSIAMEVQAGNRVIANATHAFTARIRVAATVNRVAKGDLVLPGRARLEFPTVYSSPAEVPAAEERPGEGGHPTVRVVEPTVLQGLDHAVNAAAPTELLDAVTKALEELGLQAKAVDEIRQEIAEEYLNEKTLKDRSQWWLTDSWVSGLLSVKLSRRSSFNGHLEISARPHTVRYVTTTEQEVLIRNDIADTAMFRDGGEHESSASVTPGVALGVEIGDHLATPSVDLPKVSSARGYGHTVGAQGQAKNATMRKDRLVRYRTEFLMTVTLRSDKGEVNVTRPVLGELGIGHEHAKEFERRALGGKPTGSGLVADGEFEVPASPPERAPELPPRPPRGFAQWLRDRFGGSTPPAPFPQGGVRGVADLLRLADRGPIEIALPPKYHDGLAPTGLPWSAGWRKLLLGYGDVTWVLMDEESSKLVWRDDAAGHNASWRYVVDDEAGVIGAIFMGAPREGVRAPRGYVPNPAAVSPSAEAGSQEEDAARAESPSAREETGRGNELDQALRAAGMDVVADFIAGGGVPQVQLSDALNRRLDKARSDDSLAGAVAMLRARPWIHMVAADGRRLATEDAGDGREAAEPAERPDHGVDVPPERRFVIDGEGTAHGPLRPWRHEVHPREPRALAARKGLGRGIVRETPGLEQAYPEAQKALEHQMRSAGVADKFSEVERQHLARVLAMKFGVPGLRGAYPNLIDGGVAHEVEVGGYKFTAALDAELRELRREPVAERGVTLDSQRKNAAAVDVEEKRGLTLGAGADFRFRARLAHLFKLDINAFKADYKRSWVHKVINSTGVKEYRRDRTAGGVTRFEYETAYTLTVTTRRGFEGVVAAQVRELSGDGYWTAVTVSDAHLPDTPVPADELLELGRVTVEKGPLDEEGVRRLAARPGLDTGEQFDLTKEGLSGIQVGLIGVSEVSTQLAEMVARPNQVSWAGGAKADAFQQVLAKIVPSGGRYGVAERILRAGTQTFLEANVRTAMSERGLLIPLPRTADGWQQEARVRARPFNARHEKTVKGGTLEQYTEADLRFGEENDVTDTVHVAGGLSGVGRIGGTPAAEGEHTTSNKAASQISGGLTGGGGASWARHRGELGGGLDLNLGTYSGDSELVGADLVYTIEYRRWRRRRGFPERPKDKVLRKKRRGTPTPLSYTVARHVKIDRGMEILVPYVRAADHGLPVPARDDLPVKRGERHYVDENLALAVAHVENIDADKVLGAITAILGLGADPELLRAVETAFSEEAIRAQYGIARRGGIRQVFNVPAKHWMDYGAWSHMGLSPRTTGTVHTGIRVTAREEQVAYRRPRPDVKVTTGGQGFKQEGQASSGGRSRWFSAFVHGRWASAPYGLRPAGGLSVGYEYSGRSKVGRTTVERDIRRATAQDTTQETAQEFTHTLRWDIEVFHRYTPDELTRRAGQVLAAAPFLVEVLTRGESRRMWQRLFPPDHPSAATREVPGGAAVLVPTHLTTTMARPPAAAGATSPAAPAPVVARTPAPAPSALATALGEHVQALSMPGTETLPPWAQLAAVPWRRVDQRAVARGVEPIVAEFAPGTQNGLTLDLALNERNLRANIAALLAGTYRIPLMNGKHLTVQLVPARARRLELEQEQARFTVLNFPEHAAEPERAHEEHRSWSAGAEFDFGHAVGRPLEEGAEHPLLDPGGTADRGGKTTRVKQNSTGDYVESNRQRTGDFDYYVFEAEYHITGPHGHRVVVAIPDGLVGMLPATVVARLLAENPNLLLDQPPLGDEPGTPPVTPAAIAALPGPSDNGLPQPVIGSAGLAHSAHQTPAVPAAHEAGPHSVDDASASLEDRLVDMLPPYDGTAADCVSRLETVREGLFGRPAVVRDDAALESGRPQDALAAALGGDWRLVDDSLADVADLIGDIGPGAAAFVLTSPPGEHHPSHGFVLLNHDGHVFRVETQAAAGSRVRPITDVPSRPVIGARAIVVDASGRAVVPDQAVPAARSMVNVLLDPSRDLKYGRVGVELETHFFVHREDGRPIGREDIELVEDPDAGVALRTDTWKVLVAGDRYFSSWEEAEASGLQPVAMRSVKVVEIITYPAGIIDGEEDDRWSIAEMMQSVRRTVETLQRAEAHGGRPKVTDHGTPLMQLFPENGRRVYDADGPDITILRAPSERGVFQPQITVGIPLTSVPNFFQLITEYHRSEPLRAYYEDALDIGADVRSRFTARLVGGPIDGFAVPAMDHVPGVAAVRAAMVILVTHVMAEIDVQVTGARAKNKVLGALRTSFSAIRESLPAKAKEFLEADAEHIKASLRKTIWRRFGHQIEGLVKARDPRHRDVFTLGLDNEDGVTVGDYVDSMLLPPDLRRVHVDQSQAMNVLTSFESLDDNEGRLSNPLVLVEWRYLGNLLMTMNEVESRLGVVADFAKNAYETASKIRLNDTDLNGRRHVRALTKALRSLGASPLGSDLVSDVRRVLGSTVAQGLEPLRRPISRGGVTSNRIADAVLALHDFDRGERPAIELRRAMEAVRDTVRAHLAGQGESTESADRRAFFRSVDRIIGGLRQQENNLGVSRTPVRSAPAPAAAGPSASVIPQVTSVQPAWDALTQAVSWEYSRRAGSNVMVARETVMSRYYQLPAWLQNAPTPTLAGRIADLMTTGRVSGLRGGGGVAALGGAEAGESGVGAWEPGPGGVREMAAEALGGKGKQRDGWHTLVRGATGREGTHRYEVSDAGWVELPGGERLSPDGWARYGGGFVHVATGVYLRGEDGRIERFAGWEGLRASLDEGALVAYTMSADGSHVYLTPIGGGQAFGLPLVEPQSEGPAEGAHPTPAGTTAEPVPPPAQARSSTQDVRSESRRSDPASAVPVEPSSVGVADSAYAALSGGNGVRAGMVVTDHLVSDVNSELGKFGERWTGGQVDRARVEEALRAVPHGGPTDVKGLANDLAHQIALGEVPRQRGGAIGVEAETGLEVGGPDPGYVDLITTPNYRLVIDYSPHGPNRAFVPIVEVVLNPANALDGETGWMEPAVAFDTISSVLDRLGNARPGTSIAQIFGDVPGVVVHPHARTATLMEDIDPGQLYTHFTVGVPMTGVRKFLRTIAEANENTHPYWSAMRHARSALAFGDKVAARFADVEDMRAEASRFVDRLATRHPDIATIRNYATLVYTQVAAKLDHLTGGRNIPKNNTLVVSRVALSVMRKSLPGKVRQFLEDNAEWIGARFQGRYRNDNQSALQGAGVSPSANLLAKSWRYEYEAPRTIGRYLDNALVPILDRSRLIAQDDALWVGTQLPRMDDNFGRRPWDPLVVLEVRRLGPDYKSLVEVQADNAWLQQVARDLDRESGMLRGAGIEVRFPSGEHHRRESGQSAALDGFAEFVGRAAARRVAAGGGAVVVHINGGGGHWVSGSSTGIDRAEAVRGELSRKVDRELALRGLAQDVVAYDVGSRGRFGGSGYPFERSAGSAEERHRRVQVWVDPGTEPASATAGPGTTLIPRSVAWANELTREVNSVLAARARPGGTAERLAAENVLFYYDRLPSGVWNAPISILAGRIADLMTTGRVSGLRGGGGVAALGGAEAGESGVGAWEPGPGGVREMAAEALGGKGKQRDGWHTLVRGASGREGTHRYEVSDAGWVELPGGERLSPDGWARYGGGFVHVATGVYLRGEDGRIERFAGWEGLRASLDEGALVAYTMSADGSHVYLTPIGGGQAFGLPLVEPQSEGPAEGAHPTPAGTPAPSPAPAPDVLERAEPLSAVLPEDLWWRLYLDPRDHVTALRKLPADPGFLYDTEDSPGFQQGMVDAYRAILDVPSTTRVDSDEYKRMHDIVTAHLHETFDWSGKQSDGFAPPTEFPLRGTQPHAEVLTEMVGNRPLLVMPVEYMERQTDGPKPDPVAIVNSFQLSNVIIQTVYAQSEVPRLVDTVLSRYYEEIGEARTDHDRLRAIGRVVRALQIIHPFGDANRRLNVHVLLPKLLLEQGFQPVVGSDMARLFQGGYSTEQIADALLAGQQDDLRAPIEVSPAEGEAAVHESIAIRDWVLGVLAETGPELNEPALRLAVALQEFDAVLTGEFEDDAAYEEAYGIVLDDIASAADAVINPQGMGEQDVVDDRGVDSGDGVSSAASADTAGSMPASAAQDGPVTVVDAALRLVGGLRWRGASSPDSASGWLAGETTRWGHRNHFARWIRDIGPEPNEWSTMDGWEAVLFAAYRAGAVDKAWLQRIHMEAAQAASAAVADATRRNPRGDLDGGHLARNADGEAVYQAELMRRFYRDDLVEYDIDSPERPVIPAGHWIFFNGPNHVGMSLGTRDEQGRQQMLSLWTFPSYIPEGPVNQTYTYGYLQVTSVEGLIESGGLAGQRVEYATPVWEPSAASGASEASAPAQPVAEASVPSAPLDDVDASGATREATPVRGLPAGLALSGSFGEAGRIGNLEDVIAHLETVLSEAVALGDHPEEIVGLALKGLSETHEAVGDQEWGDWLVHGGDEVIVTVPNGRRYQVKVELALPSEGVRETDRVIGTGYPNEGEKWAKAWDGEAEVRAGSSRDWSVTWSAGVSTAPVSSLLGLHFVPGFKVSAGKARSHGVGQMSIVIGRRTTPTGDAVWFNYPDARLRATVRPYLAARTETVRTVHSEPLAVKVGFPDSHVPWVPSDGDGLPQHPRLEQPIMLRGDGPGDALGPYVALESIRGTEKLLDPLLGFIRTRLGEAVMESGSDTLREMRLFLSERNQLRQYTNHLGFGHTSQEFKFPGLDGSIGLVLRAEVTSVRRVTGADVDMTTWIDQRITDFYSHHIDAGGSAGIGLTLPLGPSWILGGKLSGNLGSGFVPSLEMSRGTVRWQKLTTEGLTAAYELGVRFTLVLRSDLPQLSGQVSFSESGTEYGRVPLADVPAFEADLRDSGAPRPLSIGDHDRSVAPQPAAKEHPHIRDNRGSGPGYIELDGRSIREIPVTVMRLTGDAINERGLDPLTPMEQHRLERQVAVYFGPDGINSHGGRVMAPRGYRRRLQLPNGYSATVTVIGRRDSKPLSTGTREDRQVRVFRAVPLGVTSTQPLTALVNYGANANAKVPTGTLTGGVVDDFGLKFGWLGTRGRVDALSNSAWSFAGGIPTIEGPSRWFEYEVEFEIAVTIDGPSERKGPPSAAGPEASVRRRPGSSAKRPAAPPRPDGVVISGTPRAARLWDFMADSLQTASSPPNPASVTDTIKKGRIAYWVPEQLLFPTRAAGTDVKKVEASTDPTAFRVSKEKRERLRPGDQLLGLVAPKELSDELFSMLRDTDAFPIDELDSIVNWVTDSEQLLGLVQDGVDGGSSHSLSLRVKSGFGDQYLVLRLTAETQISKTQPGDVRSGLFEVYELTPSLQYGPQSAGGSSLSVDVNFGFEKRAESDAAWSRGRGWTRKAAQLQRGTAGRVRAIDEPVNHAHRFADVVFTFEVEHWRNTPFGPSAKMWDRRKVKVPDGLEYLRRVVNPTERPVDVPVIIDPRRLRMFGVTQSLGFPDRGAEIDDPGHNPLVDAVLGLLRDHVPGLRKRIQDNPNFVLPLSVQGRFVQPLDQLFSPTSLLASEPRLMSTGLRLTPLGIDSPYYVLIKGIRQEDFRFEETRRELSVGKYANPFDWTIESTGESSTSGSSVNALGVAPGGGRVSDVDPALGLSQSRSHGTSATRTGGASKFDLYLFKPGSHVYKGKLTLEVSLRLVPQVPWSVNSLLLGVPGRGLAAVRGVGTGKTAGTRRVELEQWVAVPDALFSPSGAMATDIGEDALVQGLPAIGSLFPPLPLDEDGNELRPLHVSSEAVRERGVVLASIDDAAISEMYQRFLIALRYSGPSWSPIRVKGPELLAEWGTQSEEALRDVMSSDFLTAFFGAMLDEQGYGAPLARAGGPFTDTHGRITVKAVPFHARAMQWVELSHEFEENRRARHANTFDMTRSSGGSGSVTETALISPSQSAGRTASKHVGATVMNNSLVGGATLLHRPRQRYLHVRASIVYAVTLDSAEQRGKLKYGQKQRRFYFRLDDAVTLLIHPEQLRNEELRSSLDLTQLSDPLPDRLRADVDAFGLEPELGRLREESWRSGQTFEKVVSDEIDRLRERPASPPAELPTTTPPVPTTTAPPPVRTAPAPPKPIVLSFRERSKTLDRTARDAVSAAAQRARQFVDDTGRRLVITVTGYGNGREGDPGRAERTGKQRADAVKGRLEKLLHELGAVTIVSESGGRGPSAVKRDRRRAEIVFEVVPLTPLPGLVSERDLGADPSTSTHASRNPSSTPATSDEDLSPARGTMDHQRSPESVKEQRRRVPGRLAESLYQELSGAESDPPVRIGPPLDGPPAADRRHVGAEDTIAASSIVPPQNGAGTALEKTAYGPDIQDSVVIDDDGGAWRASSHSDGRFCVEVATVRLARGSFPHGPDGSREVRRGVDSDR